MVTSLLVEFQVKSELCPLVRLTEAFKEVEVEYIEMASVSDHEFLEVFEVRGPQVKEFREAVTSTEGIHKVQVIEEAPERLVCQGIIGCRCIRSLLAQQGWIPLRVRASKGLERVALGVQDLEEARDLVNFVKSNYSGFELLRITSRGALGISSKQDLRAYSLTAKQEEVLQRALFAGYFDPYRKKTAKEIARSMGIDRSTFSRHLRTALRRVLSELLD
ncbi:MAG: helix-turn-helix domain-containing protein [Candidatus Thermoplasmatota archaeon]|nr:helix-turn-helix domain-containing protein [Candidatus Thermoplasmatota archaeon]